MKFFTGAVWTAVEVEELEHQFTWLLEKEGNEPMYYEPPDCAAPDYCTIGVDYGTAGMHTTVLQLRSSPRELVNVAPDGLVTITPDITLKEALVALEYMAAHLWRIKS